jgi:hypothetical protein
MDLFVKYKPPRQIYNTRKRRPRFNIRRKPTRFRIPKRPIFVRRVGPRQKRRQRRLGPSDKDINKIGCGDKYVCNYGTFPIKEPMLVDDYKLKFKGYFVKNLEKIYENIAEKNPSVQLQETTEQKDQKTFLRDIMTAYVVSNIFKTRNQNKLIHIINTIMKSLYDKFYEETGIRVFFVYRGGNILKIYKSNFEKILPGRAKKLFQQEFDDYFKNSDIDFYSIIDKADKLKPDEIERINQYVQIMCYYGLWIARLFIMNNFGLFEFCKLNRISFREDLKDLVEIMNNDKKSSKVEEIQNTEIIGLGFNKFIYIDEKYNLQQILNLPESRNTESFVPGISDASVVRNLKKYQKAGRFDSNLNNMGQGTLLNKIDYEQPNLYTEDFLKYMKQLVQKNKILDFYITNNNLIEDKVENVSFSLTRLMINFVVAFKRDGKYGFTNTSSELFDLSIGNPEDKMYYVYNSDNITTYPFKYDDDKTDEIYIPKIGTTLTDLIKILFDIDFPWLDIKYEKRLYRLLLLTFVEELSKSNIFKIEKKLKSKAKRQPKSEDDITFETLNYRNDNLKKKAKTASDKQAYKEYSKKYVNITKKLLNVVDKIKDFIQSEKQFNPNDIYEFSFDPIGE